MKQMQDIIYYNYKNKNPLAQGITEGEVRKLASDLGKRLSWSGKQLEPSQETLARLFNGLVSYYNQLSSTGYSFSENEHLQIVREITAYFGYIVIRSKGGEWDNPGGLLDVGIKFSGDFEGVKGNKITKSTIRVENLGYLAVGIWDGVLAGINIDVMKYYGSFAKKRIGESL